MHDADYLLLSATLHLAPFFFNLILPHLLHNDTVPGALKSLHGGHYSSECHSASAIAPFPWYPTCDWGRTPLATATHTQTTPGSQSTGVCVFESWALPDKVVPWLQGNPGCEEPDYRITLIHSVPSLQILDLHQVSFPHCHATPCALQPCLWNTLPEHSTWPEPDTCLTDKLVWLPARKLYHVDLASQRLQSLTNLTATCLLPG